MKVGPKPNPIRQKYADRYSLTMRQRKLLTTPFLSQLEACKSECARRLLLGVSRRAEQRKLAA